MTGRPHDPNAVRIRCLLPVLALVILATAVPVELRRLGSRPVGFDVEAGDVAANVAAYALVGLTLGEGRKVLRTILIGAAISVAAEACQLVLVHRTPSAIDVVSNTLGVTLGALAGRRLGIPCPTIRAGYPLALAAGAAVAGLIAWTWHASGPALNPRGASAPGQLEAHWSFDEPVTAGREVTDVSGHGIRGRLVGRATRIPGALGNAVQLDGKKDWVPIERASALRTIGSLTICAWIRPAAYPADDAVIVSSMAGEGRGFQLDATIDGGPRTIGFKLSDECGVYMARYGQTPLALHTWHHVAGVYRADTGSIDVYLNGKPDNGKRVGFASQRRWSSRAPVFVGRRGIPDGFGFAGGIDDVRIYSAPLTEADLKAVMQGEAVTTIPATMPESHPPRATIPDEIARLYSGCRPTDQKDSTIPAIAGLIGVLTAVACLGFRPGIPAALCLGLCAVASGLVLARLSVPLPQFNAWLVPLTGLAGGLSVLAGAALPTVPTKRAVDPTPPEAKETP